MRQHAAVVEVARVPRETEEGDEVVVGPITIDLKTTDQEVEVDNSKDNQENKEFPVLKRHILHMKMKNAHVMRNVM